MGARLLTDLEEHGNSPLAGGEEWSLRVSPTVPPKYWYVRLIKSELAPYGKFYRAQVLDGKYEELSDNAFYGNKEVDFWPPSVTKLKRAPHKFEITPQNC